MKFSLFILLILLAGCELFTDFRTITVSLPEDYPPWFRDNNRTGKLVYPGKSGKIESKTVPWEGNLKLVVEKGSCIPVAFYPSGNLRPAGGILPFDFNDYQQLQLKWENGFTADLLLDILETGVSIENLNVERLMEEIKNESKGDPWSIDKKLLKDAILYNNMSVYKIKLSTPRDISVPAAGTWISDNPFFPESSSGADEIVIFNNIYTGLHHFKETETKKYLDILVDTEGYQYLISQQ